MCCHQPLNEKDKRPRKPWLTLLLKPIPAGRVWEKLDRAWRQKCWLDLDLRKRSKEESVPTAERRLSSTLFTFYWDSYFMTVISGWLLSLWWTIFLILAYDVSSVVVLLPGESHEWRSLVLRVGHDWATSLSLFTFTPWRRKWQTHSSVLALRIPGTGEPGGLLSVGSHRVGHDWSDLAAAAVLKK